VAVTIVSFCGGGIRGFMSALIYKKLMEHYGDFQDYTHLFAGTSTGAVFVSAITAGKTPGEIVDFYREEAAFLRAPDTSGSAPAYKNARFIKTQQDWQGADTPLNDVRRQVLLTGFNVGSTGNGWYPQLFTNVPNRLYSTGQTLMVDAVVASGSMPGMLPSYNGYVDGAFVNHDPTLAAIALLVSVGNRLDDIAAICIGTGFMPQWIGSDTARWGADQWLNGDGTNNYNLPPLLVNETSVCPILNISLNGTSTNLIPNLCTYLLGDRYYNLNPRLDKYVPENASSLADHAYMTLMVESQPEDFWQPAYQLMKNYWKP
jgi:patatin-like phospholipase/acyl hydrolase